jgi:hypothetical protein
MLPYKTDFGYPFGFWVSTGLVLGMDYHPESVFGAVSGFDFEFRVSGLGAQRLHPIRIRPVDFSVDTCLSVPSRYIKAAIVRLDLI